MAVAPITSIKGIGPRRAEAFGRLGLFSVEDMLSFMPRGYIDYTKSVLMCEAEQGMLCAVKVTITGEAKTVRIRGGLTITTAAATDGLNKLQLCWYNQPYMASKPEAGRTCYACGRADKRRGMKLMNPQLCDELPGIVPQYPLVSGLTQKIMREAAAGALGMYKGRIEETLPESIMAEYSLMPRGDALLAMHMPQSFEQLERAKERMAFEDMLLYALMLSILRHRREQGGGIAFNMNGKLESFKKLLSFEPTAAQFRTMRNISSDMAKNVQMNRLVQGDVGSGKTACALFAIYAAIENGYSAALMAPTEILADQHYRTLKNMFGSRAILLKGGMKKKEREEIAARLMGGEALAITGTHAIISGGVEIANLGLVIADEQHRFGVRQRAAISAKGSAPDTLIMSATPIPRTLAIILYSDLDISVVDEKPANRLPIKNCVVGTSYRPTAYRFLEQQIRQGHQVYVVCPMVEESENIEAENVIDYAKKLSGELPDDIKVEYLHGKMKASQKNEIMEKFSKNEINVLVSTTVIEVGVNVPNATVMMVENAERFGLAQLHQLRGRVGRGGFQSYCIFVSGNKSKKTKDRLEILNKTNDGFKIAEEDLKLRGPGDFFGVRQSGDFDFGIADIYTDAKVLKSASEAAGEVLDKDPELELEENRYLAEKVSEYTVKCLEKLNI